MHVCLYERMEFYVSAREMSRVQATEEYIRVALSLKQETDVGGYCYDELSGSRVMMSRLRARTKEDTHIMVGASLT